MCQAGDPTIIFLPLLKRALNDVYYPIIISTCLDSYFLFCPTFRFCEVDFRGRNFVLIQLLYWFYLSYSKVPAGPFIFWWLKRLRRLLNAPCSGSHSATFCHAAQCRPHAIWVSWFLPICCHSPRAKFLMPITGLAYSDSSHSPRHSSSRIFRPANCKPQWNAGCRRNRIPASA